MNNRAIAASVVFASLALGTCLTAQARQKVDSNSDGTLSSEEITTAYANNKPKREQMFKDLDADHNGSLSETEVGGEANLKKLDVDGNGAVSEDEFLFVSAKSTLSKLDKADSNDDGQISQGEAQSALDKAKAKRNK